MKQDPIELLIEKVERVTSHPPNVSSSTSSVTSSSSTTMEQETSSTATPKFLLDEQEDHDGHFDLTEIDKEILCEFVQPIRKELEAMETTALLGKDRVVPSGPHQQQEGAIYENSSFLRPIHDEIQPIRAERRSGGPPLRYLHLAESDSKYSIGIFVFPPNAKIPLHDHPGMCVLSRILYGTVERISLDLLDGGDDKEEQKKKDPREEESTTTTKPHWLRSLLFGSSSSARHHRRDGWDDGDHDEELLGHRYRKTVLQAPGVTMLFPREGNLHEFRAGPQGAAVLDVLLPPYSHEDGRDCNFYELVQENSNNSTTTVRLRLIEQPDDFACLSGSFRGIGEGS